nr:MAG TPA: Sporulation inhibitor sda hairpin, histidine kinase inhibitor.97A [Caudoviricetes sp.]
MSLKQTLLEAYNQAIKRNEEKIIELLEAVRCTEETD